jgi:hypothetical protein
MKTKAPRKKEDVPHLDGWKFFPLTTNLYLFCQVCRGRPGEMFYRTVKDEGSPIFRTEAVCVPCSRKIK